MCRRKGFLTVVFLLFLGLNPVPALSQGKGILEILRDKGVITEAEYQQALEEARGQQKKAVEEVKKEAKVPDWLSRTFLFGDIRYRHEGFYNSTLTNNQPTRNRERIRARLGLGVNISEELQGRLRVVTGDAGDPISTNQTLSDLFTRKPINLDWAYITVAPWKSLGLDKLSGSERPMFTFTGGKQPVSLFLPGGSELVFDGDLSPEGVTETLTLWDQPKGFFRNFKLTGIQWNIKELGDDADAWMFGGQAQARFEPAPGWGLTLSLADYGFQRLNVIARERNTNSALLITNKVRCSNGTTAGGAPVTPAGCGGSISEFLGGFNILNGGIELGVPTPWKDWPLNLFFDLARNTDAATNDDTGIWLGFRIGRAASKGDLRFTYTFARTATDAVPSVFSYSDFGRNGGTNVMGHFVALDYVLLPRLTLTAKNHFINWIKRPAGFHNPTQSRLQLDMVLSF